MNGLRRRRALLLVLLAAFGPSSALAAEPPFPLEVESRPVLPGALETVVEIRNPTDVAIAGHVELMTEDYRRSFRGSTKTTAAEKPFTIGPKAVGRITLLATTHDRYETTTFVRIDDGPGHEVVQTAGRYYGNTNHVFVDLGGHTALLGALNDAQVPSATGGSREHVSATAPTATASGVTTLPTTLGGYANASTVHLESSQLLRLGQPELIALVDWTARGGTLAVSVDDAAHLGDSRFASLLGGRALAEGTQASSFGDAPLVSRQEPDEAAAEAAVADRARPTERETPMRRFTGGNLQASEYGGIAAYGLGRVVLLPFRAPLLADDPWAVGKLAELTLDSTSHAKRKFSELDDQSSTDNSQLKRALDPNEHFRVGLGIATAVLLGYAAAVAFLLVRDNKKRRLFRPFAWLPLLAASVSAAIVLLGFVARGSQRGLRRVLVVEGGAGFGLVSVDEYRGYFTSGSDVLTVASQSPRSLLYASALGPLHLRDGLSFFQGKAELPWQTTITRELRVEQSEQNVAIGETAGIPWVKNRTASTLEDVLVTSSTGVVYLFPRIAPDEHVEANDSLRVSNPPSSPNFGFYPQSFTDIAPDEATRLEKRYELLAPLIQGKVVHPPDVPSLLARATGATPYLTQGETGSDAALPLETMATFVHVVGEGGTP